MEMKLFATISPQQFAGIIRWFKNNTAKAKLHLENASAYALAIVFDTGDVTKINQLAGVVEAFGFGPKFRRCVVPNVPFAYDKEGLLFTGKIQKGKRAALSEINPDGIPMWEADMRKRFDEEAQPKEKREKVAEDYLKAIDRAIAQAIKHDVAPAVAKKRAAEAIRTNTVAEVKAA